MSEHDGSSPREPDGPMSSGRRLARDSALMASGSFVSRILGVVRASMIFAIFGDTVAGSTWQVANTLPTTVYLLLAGGVLNAVLVPQITKAEQSGKEGERYVDTLLTLSILGLALVTAVTLPLAAFLVRIFASSGAWNQAAFDLSTRFATLCLPAIFFYGLYTLLGQVLNARGRFGWYMWAPVLCNVVWIVGLLVYRLRYAGLGHAVRDWSPGMVALLAGTMTLGVATQALVLVVPLWRDGFRLRPRFGWRGIGLGSAGRVATWTFFSLCVTQVGFVVVSRVLTTVPDGQGGRMSYDTGYLLFMTPHGLITVSLVTALFTSMSRAAAAGRTGAVARDIRRGMRLIAVTTVPVTVGAWALGTAATRVILPGNTIATTDVTGYILWAMALGLPAYGVYYLVQRGFYAYEDARTPFNLTVVNAGVGSVAAAAALLAPTAYRAVGVATGQAVANIVTAVVAVLWLRRRLGGLYLADVAQTFARSVVAAAPAGVAAYLVFLLGERLPSLRLGALLALLVGGPLFVAIYVVGARRVRLSDVDDLARPVLDRLSRLGARRGG